MHGTTKKKIIIDMYMRLCAGQETRHFCRWGVGVGIAGLFLMSVSIDADAGTDVCLSLGSCSG